MKKASLLIVIVILAALTFNAYAAPFIETEAGIKRVQYNLLILGYDLQLSGELDQATIEALKDFQAKNDLAVTGKINKESFYRLEETVSFKRHQVTKGETLSQIAQEYGLSLKALQTFNNKETTQLEVGEELLIPQNKSGSLTDYRLNKIINYKIQPGDSLADIAQEYGTTVEELKRINQITYQNITRLKIIRIPMRITESQQRNENLTRSEILRGFKAPTNQGKISSDFGYRMHPVDKTRKLHEGVDIALETGTPIRAVQQGQVLYAGWVQGYGKTVTIDHGNGVVSLYGHNSSLEVEKGREVEQGELIARAGNTGKSTGPHLHLGTYVDNEPVDPMQYLN